MDVILTKEVLGENEDEADLSWLVEDGSDVEPGAELADLETSKATVQLVAPVKGTVAFKVETGDVVSIGDVVATIE